MAGETRSFLAASPACAVVFRRFEGGASVREV